MPSEQETFDKLRRVDYNTACAAYSSAIMYFHSGASLEIRKELADPVLIPLGWIVEDIFNEANRRRSLYTGQLW